MNALLVNEAHQPTFDMSGVTEQHMVVTPVYIQPRTGTTPPEGFRGEKTDLIALSKRAGLACM